MSLQKKIGNVFTSKFVGTGPSSYEKTNLPGRELTKVEKHWSRPFVTLPRLIRTTIPLEGKGKGNGKGKAIPITGLDRP